MSPSEPIAVVIPVYNQPQHLRDVVTRSLKVHARVLVIDDGSDENAADLLGDLPAEVLRHEVNRGKGAALQTAAAHLRARGVTHMITLDADGQHYPEDIPAFVEAIRQHPEALIVGVRDFAGSGVPGASRFGRAFGNFWVWVQTGTPVKDVQSGFRAYPLALLERLRCWCKGYAFEVEVVVRGIWAGLKVHQIPVRVHYPQREHRNSHFHKLHDNVRLSLLNTHLTMRALLPWPHRQIVGPDAETSVTIWHPLRSIRMLLTEHATPHGLAFAVAVGVFLGAVPLIACHTLVILMVTAVLRLNRVAAVAASQICMPPVVPALCIETGYFMRHGRFLTLAGIGSLRDATFLELGYKGLQLLWEWLLGSLVVGTVLAVVLGGAVYVVARVLARARRAV